MSRFMRPYSRLTVIMNEASGGAASHPDMGVAIGRLGLDVEFIRVKGAGLRSIPTDIDAAVAAIAGGHTRALDVGDVNGHTFLNNASLGIYPHIVWEREVERCRGRGKWTAFALAVVRTWRRYPTVAVRMTIRDMNLVQATPFVFVGNGEYRAEGLGLGTRASLNSGRLSIYLAPDYGRFEFLTLPFRAIAGQLAHDVKFEAFSAREAVLAPSTLPRMWFRSAGSAQSPVTIALDGELADINAPLRSTILPRALCTIVPEVS